MIQPNPDTNDSIDPLRSVYHESVINIAQHRELLISRDAALLCIDMQYLDAAPGHGVFARPDQGGVSAEGQAWGVKNSKNFGIDMQIRIGHFIPLNWDT